MGKLIIFGLIVIYIGGVWKFWNGFSRTNFTQSLPNKIGLALLSQLYLLSIVLIGVILGRR